MSRPTMSKDGRRRVTLRIEWRADLTELAAALTMSLSVLDEEVPPTVKAVRARTIDALRESGADPLLSFGDQMDDDCDGELAALYQQAVPAVARAFGFTTGEADAAVTAMLDRPTGGKQ